MIEEIEIEAYLLISPNEFEINLFNKKKRINLYKQKLQLSKKNDIIDIALLIKFLEDNIFKIEKLIGKFIKNIILVIESKKINSLVFGIKKKNYENKINKKFLENSLTDAKDLFSESYQQEKIMHILINKCLVDGKHYSLFKNAIKGENLCIEIEFKSLPKSLSLEIEKVLQKYQIKVSNYLDGNYIKNFFKDDEMDTSKMVYEIQNGVNQNEVKLIPKNAKKIGFFVKFFQLFS
tara:strand:+ start:19 stop:723 length:705 start_codon:yes stop_codon:yes gene_type:complete